MPDADLIRHSVTKDDYTDDAGKKGASVLNFMFPPTYGIGAVLPNMPPEYWTPKRDAVYRQTPLFESMWASSVYIASTKMSSLSWKVRGPELRARKTRDMLMNAEAGKGWVYFLQKHLRDFMLTDNGAFIEIVRDSPALFSKIIGIVHLDSIRCTRTGDPDIPVIYRDKQGREHEIKDHQVICLSDEPDPSETWYGVGHCAASRAYSQIYKMGVIENYLSEKVTGRRPLSLHFINNVAIKHLQQGIKTAEADSASQGYVNYMGAVIIPNIDPTSVPNVATIQLAGLPENFVAADERRASYLAYANAIGLDPQEIDPQLLASRSMGTGAQARVIDDKASGKGLVAWRQQFVHAFNEFLIPRDTTFSFQERDYRDQLQEMQVQSQRTDLMANRVNAGFLTAQQGQQMLADCEDIPVEFLDMPDMSPTGDAGSDTNRLNIPQGMKRPPVEKNIPANELTPDSEPFTRELSTARDNSSKEWLGQPGVDYDQMWREWEEAGR